MREHQEIINYFAEKAGNISLDQRTLLPYSTDDFRCYAIERSNIVPDILFYIQFSVFLKNYGAN